MKVWLSSVTMGLGYLLVYAAVKGGGYTLRPWKGITAG